jgi:RNA polymerase sigma factor (sigma-70 family)
MHQKTQIGAEKKAQTSPEHDAFISQLYELYAARLLAFVHRQIVSLHDAEDILLEVFLLAIQHAPVLLPLAEEKQRAWLWTVARHRIADYYRLLKRRKPGIPLESIDDIEDTLITPEQEILRVEKDAELQQMIQKLPQQQQRVLTLRFLAELPCSEIASIMGKSENATRTMLSRAMHTLRRVSKAQKTRN